MLGLFLASLWLSATLVGASLFHDEPEGLVASSAWCSLRFWILFAIGFGLVGTPLTMLAIGPFVSLAAATAGGLTLGRLLWPLFEDSTAEIGLAYLAGAEGRVLLPVGSSNGKIVVETLASRVELPARSGDGRVVGIGRRVFVAFVENGVAWVVDLGGR